MKIFIAADHRGFKMKEELVEWLASQEYDVVDLGASEYDKDDDYPDYGIKVAESVAENPTDHFGILLCGSGVGMSVVADKVAGIRAALIHDPAIAEVAQRDDDINVLALGADYLDFDVAKDIIERWLNTPFSGEERHRRRIDKISQYEQQHGRRADS